MGRQSNIELLRITAILGVIILHYNNAGMGGGFAYSQHGSLNYYILFLFESFAICAVNVFFMISGYFMTVSYKRSIRKPIQLIIQVIVFQLVGLIIKYLFFGGSISARAIISRLLPANYFVILYCVIYFFSPYINRLFDILTYKDVIEDLVKKKPNDPAIKKGAAMKKQQSDGQIEVTILYLDANNEPVWGKDENNMYGCRIITKQLDTELLNMFGDKDIIIFE